MKPVSGGERESHALAAILDFPGKKDFPWASVMGCVAPGGRGRQTEEPGTGARAACPQNTQLSPLLTAQTLLL